MKKLEKKYNIKDSEAKWQQYWQDNEIFKFDWNDTENRDNIYSIDTPPPHVSGSLHMGHIFSYTQMDIMARFKRMFGKNVFFPVGFDDNGLPSERYVEKKINKKSKSMDRQEFVKICDKEIQDAEQFMKDNFIKISHSYDFNLVYRTISPVARKVSQMSFLDLYSKGKLYRKEEPIIWDVVDQTALAQTEAEDAEVESKMNYIEFRIKNEELRMKNKELSENSILNSNDAPHQNSKAVLTPPQEGSDSQCGDKLVIMTTRPELLPACVAIFAHPDDKAKYKGKVAITPLGIEVPILFDESVEKDKGTGVMMCCTFGDNADVEKYKKYNLPLKIIINEKGCLYFDNVPEIAEKYKTRLDGLFTTKAREEILNILQEEGKIVKEPEKIVHNVKVGERSKSPLEILVKNQWNIDVLSIKDELHKKASEVKWYPDWMEGRIHSWIDGLNWNWTISRQRFFGVPVPCWYSKRSGEEGKVILPNVEDLPIDPTVDLPKGYTKNEVIGETDVFDTWMTSSVSPQLSTQCINDNFCCDKERVKAINLPFDLRAQAHDIIRTWAFCTIAKAYYHENKIPWKNIFISGYCLASDGTKMSKSKGNGVDPIKALNEFGADPIRYWAGKGTLGSDTPYSVDVIKNGQKLITKLYNSAKFCEMNFENIDGELSTAKKDVESGVIFEKIDLWLISRIKKTISSVIDSFENYKYNVALDIIENFFWNDFCDNYLEIAKARTYGLNFLTYSGIDISTVSNEKKEEIIKAQQSAIRTIYYVFNAALKLFAPFMPSICDEIYSFVYEGEFEKVKSISARGNFAKAENFVENDEAEKIGEVALSIVANVRKYKSDKNISIKEKIEKIDVYTPLAEQMSGVVEDLKNVCNVNNIDFIKSNDFKIVF